MPVPTRLKDHLEKLRVLVAVARSGSITKAATVLHMTQAAVSQSIKALEQALEFDLIVREPKGIRLTERGGILCEFSKRMFLEIEAVEGQLANPQGGPTGALRIGTHETLAIHVWPDLLDSFRLAHPQVSVSLISGRIDGLMTALQNYEHHVVLSVEPEKRPDLVSMVLYEGSMRLFASKGTANRMTMKEASLLPILTDAAAHVREGLPIPSFLASAGFALDRFHELNSFEAAMRIAALGFGLALVPDRNAAESVRAGRLQEVEITDRDLGGVGRYKICASWLKRNETYASLKLLEGFLRERFEIV